MKTLLTISLLFLGVVSQSVDAWGFDGQRKGFVLGGGVGWGITSFTVHGGWHTESGPFNYWSFVGGFKIGHAPSNQIEMVYSNKVSFFSASDPVLMESALHGLHTATVNYYFRPDGPGFFIGGGLGVASLALITEVDEEIWTGLAFHVGGGFGFSKHSAVAADLAYGLPRDRESGEDYRIVSLSITVISTAF